LSNQQKIGVIILAAGESKRLGRPKQLVRFRDQYLLDHALKVAGSIDFVTKILILGANYYTITKQIQKHSFAVVQNEHWQEGMASSIRKGVEGSLKNCPKLEQIMILVGDQPLVNRQHLQNLIDSQLQNNSEASFSEYEGNLGVPAIFSERMFPELLKLKGDHGAKKLLFKSNLEYSTVKLEGGHFDVDTEADVERLKAMEQE